MAKGDRVTASAFNTIQAQALSVLGQGTGESGYGQLVSSSSVAANTVISSTQWDQIRLDLSRCYTHQTGAAVLDGLATVYPNPPYLQDINPGTIISDFIRAQYLNFVTNTSDGINGGLGGVNKFRIASGQFTPNVQILSAQRTAAWGGSIDTITHVVTITFSGGYSMTSTSGTTVTATGADHRRHFFNAGGILKVQASLTGGSGSKYLRWQEMLSGFNTFKISAKEIGVTGSTLYSASPDTNLNAVGGFWDLTSSNQRLFSQGGPGGVYSENRYIISARLPTTNTIELTITFQDNDAGDQTGLGPAVDEDVTGTLTSTILIDQPTGSNVSLTAPTAVTAGTSTF